MNRTVHKVTAFVTQQRRQVPHLLLFRHPTAGIQIPAGTVEDGEAPEAAALREAGEETGLGQVRVERYLGCWENELQPGECIIARITPVHIERDLRSMPYQRPLTRGLTVGLNALDDAFARVTYIEHDRYPDPQCIVLNITGWVPADCVATCKRRHFVLLSSQDDTFDEWSQPADEGHVFRPFWAPLEACPRIIEPQDSWYRFLLEQLT